MIGQVIGKAANLAQATDYQESPDHDAMVLAWTLDADLPSRDQARRGSPASGSGATGRGLDALLDYVENGGDNVQITPEARAEMEARAALRPRTKDAYFHFVLSYDMRDGGISDDLMAQDADDAIHHLCDRENHWRCSEAARKGHPRPATVDADSILYVAVRHREKQHQHVHVVACRVDSDGQLFYGARSGYALRNFCQRLEDERGWHVTRTKREDPDFPDDERDEVPADRAHLLPRRRDTAIGVAERDRAAPSDIARMREEMQAVAAASTSREDLIAKLAERGVTLEPAAGGRGYIVRGEDGATCSASYAGLLGRYSPDRIGAPQTPTQRARLGAWEAMDAATDYRDFRERLGQSGLAPVADRSGRVTGFRQVDAATGKPRRGGKAWTPRELGMRRPPKTDDGHWRALRSRPTKAKALPRPVELPDRIRLRPPVTTQAGLEAMVADRSRIRDRIEARDKAKREAEQQAKNVAATAGKAADRSAGTQQERDLLAGRVQRMHKFNTLTREPEALSDFMAGQGVAVSYDEKTRGWYAQQGQTVAALPFLGDRPPRSGWQPKAAASTPTPIPRIADAAKPKADGPSLPRMPMPSGPKRDKGPRR